MKKIVFPLVLLVVGGLSACSSDDAKTAADAGIDQGTDGMSAGDACCDNPDTGADAGKDTGSPDVAEDVFAGDACCDDADTGTDTGVTDAAEDVFAGDACCDDAALPDGATDAGSDASVKRPAGQCKIDSDCPSSLQCRVNAPGGLCFGCGGDSECGDPKKFACYMGTCNVRCIKDTDCPSGLHCTGTGRCGLNSCGADCPAPYTCSDGSNFCNRQMCGTGKPPCPTGTSCGSDDYCIEN